MAVIVPTVTVETPQEYEAQLGVVSEFASRIHIDVADDEFTPRKLLSLSQVYLPQVKTSDIHVMLAQPGLQLMTLISLRPNLVIFHAESEGNLLACVQELQHAGIKAGLALLPDTTVESAAELLLHVDHALIFAGHLGYQDGQADMSQTKKIAAIRALNPTIEIGWDGGVSDENVTSLVAAGVDVVNSGGFIHHAPDPAKAFQTLKSLV